VPKWFFQYADASGPVVAAFERFWTNEDGIQDAFVAMWTAMAERFGTRPGVAGFELLNEPGWGKAGREGMEKNLLVPLVLRTAAAVRKVAPAIPIFQGGSGQNGVEGATSVPDVVLPGFVWAPHRYDALVMIGLAYTGGDASRALTAALAKVGEDRGHPVFFGEFGAPNPAKGQRDFVRDTYAVLDERLAHGTFWEASWAREAWNSEDLSALDAEGRELPVADDVARGYPRAVAGTLERFAWDADAHRLEVRITSSWDGITEVHAPPRHVGALPAITVDGGCFDWDGATGRLLVRASAPDVTVRVAP
jgi:hypothetical protein